MGINALASVLVASLVALTGICNFGYTIIKDKLSNKKEDLQNTQSMLGRMEEIRNSKKYLQDLEIDKVTFLKGFKWREVEVLLSKNIGLVTISNLRYLNKDGMIIFKNNSIIIPNKIYILRKKILRVRGILISLNFILPTFALLCLILFYQISIINYLIMLAYILFAEAWALYYFNSIISFNDIKESEDIANNNIFISEDFDSERQR